MYWRPLQYAVLCRDSCAAIVGVVRDLVAARARSGRASPRRGASSRRPRPDPARRSARCRPRPAAACRPRPTAGRPTRGSAPVAAARASVSDHDVMRLARAPRRSGRPRGRGRHRARRWHASHAACASCRRPSTRSTPSSNDCTPTLTRVTPACANARTTSASSESGFASTVISAPPRTAKCVAHEVQDPHDLLRDSATACRRPRRRSRARHCRPGHCPAPQLRTDPGEHGTHDVVAGAGDAREVAVGALRGAERHVDVEVRGQARAEHALGIQVVAHRGTRLGNRRGGRLVTRHAGARALEELAVLGEQLVELRRAACTRRPAPARTSHRASRRCTTRRACACGRTPARRRTRRAPGRARGQRRRARTVSAASRCSPVASSARGLAEDPRVALRAARDHDRVDAGALEHRDDVICREDVAAADDRHAHRAPSRAR